jgi:hypothetical protein
MSNLNTLKYNLSQKEIDSVVKTAKIVKACSSLNQLNNLLSVGVKEVIND